MNTSAEKNESVDSLEISISHLSFMSGLCRTGPEALQLRKKAADADLSIPEEVLTRLKMGQETVE